MTRKLFVAILLIMSATGLRAQGQIITDRPDQTEASSTIPAGYFQVEAGTLFMHEQINAQQEVRTSALPNALFRIGVVERFELRVVVQPELVRNYINDIELTRDFGIADLQAGFKVQFCEEDGWLPEIGFLSHVVFPTGTESFTNFSYGTINKLAFTHTLNEKHSIAYNIGYDYFGQGNGDLFYSLAWGISIGEKTGLYIEPYGFYQNFETWVVNADAGFTYLLSDNVQLDYSFGIGVNNLMNYQSFGVSFRLPR